MRLLETSIIRSAATPGDHGKVYSSTALCSYRDGDVEVLLCGHRVGASKVGADGRIELRESRDGGATWAAIPSPLDGEHAGPLTPPGGEYQLAGSHLASSADGTVILVAARMRVVAEGSPDYDPQAAGIVDAECVFVRRDADGWGEPFVVDARRMEDEWAIPCGPPVHLGGSRWFAPGERHAKSYVPEWLRGYHAFGLVSVDDGRTWVVVGDMMNDPDRVVVYYDQHLAVLDDGKLLSLAWVHDVVADVTLPARAGWSDDSGATWSAPVETPIHGGPVAPVHFGGGRVLAAYPHREEPAGVRVCRSPDGGVSWDVASEFIVWDLATRSFVGRPAGAPVPPTPPDPLWDTMWGWSFGLPAPTALADGNVGLAFYAIDDEGRAQVCFARVDWAS